MTKDLILKKAFELTKDDGIENLSMRKLAVEVGCTPSTIYHHFADKNEMLNELILFVEREHRARKFDDISTFEQVINSIFNMDKESEEYHRFITKYCRASFLTEATKEELLETHEKYRKLWNGFRENGELRKDLNRKAIFTIIVGAVRQVAADDDIDDETRKQIVEIIIKGLSSE